MMDQTKNVPLSDQQKRMLVLHEVDTGNVAYNNGFAYWLRGELDLERLRRALDEVVGRHEILRTRFAMRDGSPVGWLPDQASWSWEVCDLRERSPEPEQRALQLAKQRLAERLDLATAPWCCVLYRTAAGEALLTILAHHIVCDAASFSVLADDLWTAYEHGSASPPDAPSSGSPSYAAPAYQYREYAKWQASQRQRKAYQSSVDYFVRRIEGAPRCLELPWDRPRPRLQSYRGGTIRRALPDALLGRARDFAGQHEATPFMVFYAAFAALLRIYSRQQRLVVGVPTANRERSEFQSSIGFYVNTLPLSLSVDDDASFGELVSRTRDALLEALDHQGAQIEDIIERLKLPRDASYQPLYQVLFSFQSINPRAGRLGALQTERVLLGMPGARADIVLDLHELNGTLWLYWEYNSDLFDPESIVCMAECYELLLSEGLAQPEAPARTWRLVPERQRDLLLREWASKPLPFPEVTVGELIRDQARRTPDALAVLWRNERWSYQRLDARADEVARALAGAGVKHGDVVAVFSERTPELIAGLLAVWRLGAAYLPLDPSYPSDRLRFMVEDSRARAALVGGAVDESLLPETLPKVSLDSPRSAGLVPSVVTVEAKPTDLAYVIYTSGSTGRPKGVCIEHRSAVAFLAWGRMEYSTEDLSLMLASTSVCFDLSVFEIFLPLSSGGSIFLVRDALELCEFEQFPPVTFLNLVSSAMAELLRRNAVPKSVRIVNFGGELPSNEVAQKSYALGHVTKVYNVYGPTEDTVYSMSFVIPRGSVEVPAIGRSIPNSGAYVLDEHRRLLPIGAPGELYLTGVGLARGYHQRPELTAERFIQVELSPNHHERAYRTGDLSRAPADGEIRFLGRMDYQVKVRGYRVELGEVDQALTRCKGVRNAVTVTWRDRTGEVALVAYYEAEGAEPSQSAIREQLRQWLPVYMIPTHLVCLPELPRTPNGKVARSALPPPPDARGSGSELREGTLEPTIAKIYGELLEVSGIGGDDDFFALGGYSLLAARAAARLSESAGVPVSLRDVFANPRLRDLAEVLEGRRSSAEVSSPSALVDAESRVVAAEFPGYHVNCFVHCVIQSLNLFQKRPIHELNEVAAAFLAYRLKHRRLDPEAVLSPTLFREVVCDLTSSIDDRLRRHLDFSSSRLRLASDTAQLQALLAGGAFPILVGGTERVLEPSLGLVGCNAAGRHFVALNNDFGGTLKAIPYDSARLRPGEEVLAILPPASDTSSWGEKLVTSWREHLQVRLAAEAGDALSLKAWLQKYEARQTLPNRAVLRTELEGVNVTIGSELSGYLQFERYVAERLPAPLQTPPLSAYVALLGRVVADYRHAANVLRRALLLADELEPAALNAKIVQAIQTVMDRQRTIAAALRAVAEVT